MYRTFLLGSFVLPTALSAQVVNGYAQVTGIAGSSLTLGVYNESGAPFIAGKQIIIMQMQDDVIGANTADNVNFGNLASIQDAGRFEVRAIAGVSRDAFGAPVGITMDGPLGGTFNTGANSSLQVITYELLGGGGDHTTTGNVSALPWNGSIGGVVAIRVDGVFTIAHRITADGAGFRGGARDPWYYTTPCNATTYRASSVGANTNRFATKGEGIYKLTNNAWADGRGKIINGGGGGNMINAGGGGGGNYTAGGTAARGWSCAVAAGGFGGLSLAAHVDASRVFMGGGGGGGEGNDNVSTDGSNGGGIILITAHQIRTTGSCSGVRISADGSNAANSGNDGAGGAGAGGSIVLQCPSYSFAAGCPMVIRANGGNGGSVLSSTHCGGGGGGQGVIISSSSFPSSNITVQALNGVGGCDDASCTTRANGGAGSNNAGVVSGVSGVLPVELLDFRARAVGEVVALDWSTATERENDHFIVERSDDLVRWSEVSTVAGAGDSQSTIHYEVIDRSPYMGLSYYRLLQVDRDGSMTYSDAVVVDRNEVRMGMVLAPNPCSDRLVVMVGSGTEDGELYLLNELGQRAEPIRNITSDRVELDVSDLPEGMYLLVLNTGQAMLTERVMVQR